MASNNSGVESDASSDCGDDVGSMVLGQAGALAGGSKPRLGSIGEGKHLQRYGS